jgi:general secretion pathway protein G
MASLQLAARSSQKRRLRLARRVGGLPADSRRPGRPAGFTLIELLVVLAIIATLLALAAPRYFQHVERSKEAVLRENLATMRDAIDQFHADRDAWPASLQDMVDRRYLRAVPKDPVTDSSETWIQVPPPDGSTGVYDVHSGAEGKGADGTPFTER